MANSLRSQSTQRGSVRSGSSCSPRPSDGRPQQPDTPPLNGRHSMPTPAPSSSTTRLTFQNLALRTQAATQLCSQSAITYDARTQAIHNTLQQLGITLPVHAVAELAHRFDSMTSIERFLAGEGYWVPPVKQDGYKQRASNTGRHESLHRG